MLSCCPFFMFPPEKPLALVTQGAQRIECIVLNQQRPLLSQTGGLFYINRQPLLMHSINHLQSSHSHLARLLTDRLTHLLPFFLKNF